MKLSAASAIVTGGASGLGAATAEALAREGAKVAIWDLNADKGEALAEKLGGVFCSANVADEQSVQAALANTLDAIGTPRVLVNCAGIAIGEKTVGKNGPHRLDSFRKVIEVNLIGAFNCIRLVAAEMEKLDPLEDGERGVIINTASVAAFEGQIGQAAYSASKGAVAAMTLPVARDLMNAGVRCNTIAPGIFETPMMAGMDPKIQEALAAMVPFPKRLGRPAEFASLAVEICRNVMLNGAVIRLDGAIRMQPK
ncbi:3-hydroxyacyl-CoA dehydrogenase [Amphiplicatus metriothermophilus]|uniref:NAD(P)-dependent dehydrogenase, short-chain alcohol dehydrogenase family n=1 Tax=Amphiplicatus metriothermophilus TaxID=1519374 RepID=A0A239PM10_9PROT|nr:3-hydroxyacyl-CoA dehydrogenase [Amphiplicatus metriothermophilus]MBB5517531.1 NAD(P)-dependent dehydrogenase (short-subunit alcohol dehydrogenase family) [Amphiplicatus metriothermophilus]SNT68134.1 NAD(P)-dependent dehydrogenase, short-chain alcohol dehydrogenase family [Amphiplicatus metriothermophilus]